MGIPNVVENGAVNKVVSICEGPPWVSVDGAAANGIIRILVIDDCVIVGVIDDIDDIFIFNVDSLDFITVDEQEATVDRQVTVVVVVVDAAAVYVVLDNCVDDIDFVDSRVIVEGLSSGAKEGFLKVVRFFGGGVEGSEEG
ncbi:hypothetical protein NDU88_006898 [Pleurodeles waltl]|uniref:Uncharacterized protein n=1 Tax=Pleurodeles waltl TaxID=8319 RepID=A0AAV7LQZ2_PLEWA|nr:hypothetical protein NDU88_006898 [Pleurodeles waltl]